MLDPTSLTLLLHEYRESGHQDLSDALGRALAVSLRTYENDSSTYALARWLRAFTEASALSEDTRLFDAVRALAARLVHGWPALTKVDEASVSIDACLTAAPVIAGSQAERDVAAEQISSGNAPMSARPRSSSAADLVARAVDELERVIGAAYRPGGGVAHRMDEMPHTRGGFTDHVYAAAALLTAYEITGRLPYSMLGEELMQASRGDISSSDDFGVSCEAARVLSRLAALHADPEYRGAAVIATGADYFADAERVFSRWFPIARSGHADAALYALAVKEWRSALAGHR